MASKLYIREYAGISGMQGGMQAPSGFIKDQVVDYSGGVASSAAFGEHTKVVEWYTDTACSWVEVKPGLSTAATTSNVRRPADTSGFLTVIFGTKISVIANP